MAYIYSTMTADQNYALYPKDIDYKKIPKPQRLFFVAGGANVINKNMVTPRGVATQISPEDLKILERIKAFQQHVEKGYLTIDNARTDADKVAKNMTARDRSAQLEEKDFDADKAPKVNKDD